MRSVYDSGHRVFSNVDVLTMRAVSRSEALRILNDKARQFLSIVFRAPVRNSALQKVDISGHAVQIVRSCTPHTKYNQQQRHCSPGQSSLMLIDATMQTDGQDGCEGGFDRQMHSGD